MILYKLSTSPFEDNAIMQCLDRIQVPDAIILIQDAVYATKHQEVIERMAVLSKVFVLQDDLQARGMNNLHTPFSAIDYSQFVELSLTYHQVVSW